MTLDAQERTSQLEKKSAHKKSLTEQRSGCSVRLLIAVIVTGRITAEKEPVAVLQGMRFAWVCGYAHATGFSPMCNRPDKHDFVVAVINVSARFKSVGRCCCSACVSLILLPAINRRPLHPATVGNLLAAYRQPT